MVISLCNLEATCTADLRSLTFKFGHYCKIHRFGGHFILGILGEKKKIIKLKNRTELYSFQCSQATRRWHMRNYMHKYQLQVT